MTKDFARCSHLFDRLRELGYPCCITYEVAGYWTVAAVHEQDDRMIKVHGSGLEPILREIIRSIEHKQISQEA